MSKKTALFGFLVLAVLAVLVIFKGGTAGSNFLWSLSQGGTFLLPLVIFSALLDSINPCAFSVLLVTIAFLLTMGSTRAKVLSIGGVYIFGIFAAYLLIGLGLLNALHIFGIPHFMGKLGAAALIIFGAINLLNEIIPGGTGIKLGIPAGAHRSMGKLMNKATPLAMFLLGALVGLCEFPCTGGPYLMILGLLHDASEYAKGFGYLIIYNLIFILPLLAILLLAADQKLLLKLQEWKKAEMRQIRVITAGVMVLLGVLILLVS